MITVGESLLVEVVLEEDNDQDFEELKEFDSELDIKLHNVIPYELVIGVSSVRDFPRAGCTSPENDKEIKLLVYLRRE